MTSWGTSRLINLVAPVMTPLMRGQMDRLAVFVTDIAGLQPALHPGPVGVRRERLPPVNVGSGSGEQVGVPLREAVQHSALLGTDLGFEFLVDGDGGLPFHLGVVVAQVGSTLAVVEQTVEGQVGGGGDPQPAADEDQGDQTTLGIGPAVEVGGLLDLGHDVLGQVAGDALPASWEVSREEHRSGGQCVVPAVLPDGLEEQVQTTDPALVGARPAGLVGQPGQEALQQRPVDAGQPGDVRGHGREELAELGERLDVAERCRDVESRCQPQPHPAFAEFLQPRLGELGEPQATAWPGAAGAVLEAGKLAQTPDISRIFDLPADAVTQRLDDIAGIEQERVCSGAQTAAAAAIPSEPSCSSHSSSFRSSREVTPLFAALLTVQRSTRGGAVAVRASWRHWTAY